MKLTIEDYKGNRTVYEKVWNIQVTDGQRREWVHFDEMGKAESGEIKPRRIVLEFEQPVPASVNYGQVR